MGERFRPGARVRARLADPGGHSRAPRYVRGHVGVVADVDGTHPLPDDVVAGVAEPRRETVYSVRFTARDLFGGGDHDVSVDLWDSYLEVVRDHPPGEVGLR